MSENLNEIQFLVYEDDNHVEVFVWDETLWATQKAISQLFDVGIPAISKHLKNIFESGELDENRTVSKKEIVQNEGGREIKRKTTFYSLDVIISVGYRVNSQKATKFRIWATGVLKEYIQKGFKIDAERMKQGEVAFGKDYFRELLEIIRSIRASERRIWQQITDILLRFPTTTTRILILQNNSMRRFKISFTMLLREKQQLRLSMTVQTRTKTIWG